MAQAPSPVGDAGQMYGVILRRVFGRRIGSAAIRLNDTSDNSVAAAALGGGQ